jgi:hypothetical protein
MPDLLLSPDLPCIFTAELGRVGDAHVLAFGTGKSTALVGRRKGDCGDDREGDRDLLSPGGVALRIDAGTLVARFDQGLVIDAAHDTTGLTCWRRVDALAYCLTVEQTQRAYPGRERAARQLTARAIGQLTAALPYHGWLARSRLSEADWARVSDPSQRLALLTRIDTECPGVACVTLPWMPEPSARAALLGAWLARVAVHRR